MFHVEQTRKGYIMDKSARSMASWFANDLEDLCEELLNDYSAYGKDPDTYFQDCFQQKIKNEFRIRIHVLKKAVAGE